MEAWREFYAMAAQGLAALTGLFFVAMSLHLPAITARPALSRSVTLALGAMVGLLLLCGLMLVPGVTMVQAGAAVSAVGFGFAVSYGITARRFEGMTMNIIVSTAFGLTGLAMTAGWSPAAYVFAGLVGLSAAAMAATSWRILTASLLR